ncbi:MAG TPA: DUF3592 domain-containing protein [Verrucomicrobiae bacterium]|nr:DUF3592 domain-containing protein [Verrucomicrobiae bacterium]
MLHQYLILFGSAFAIAALAISYALFCQTRRSRRLFLTVIFLVVTLWLDFHWGVAVIAQFNTRRLPSTTGEIIHKDVTHYWSNGRFPGMRTDVSLTYSYSVAGQSYTCNRIRLIDGLCILSSDSMTRWGHPVNSQVTVFYDPQNPQTAFLSVGLNAADDWLTLVVLAGANVLPFYFCFMAFRPVKDEDVET